MPGAGKHTTILVVLFTVTGRVKAANPETERDTSALNEEKCWTIERDDECGRMESAIRGLGDEKSRKNDQMKSVDDELAKEDGV